MVGCPLMCNFCPQDNLRKSYGDRTKYLQVADLEVMLDKLPGNTRIDFSGMAEPWANPDCTDMLKLTLEKGFTVAIYTTLHKMKDAQEVVRLLEKHNSQVEVVMLHLPDANGNMKGWKVSDEWKEALKIISQMKLACGIGAMTMDGSGLSHPELQSTVRRLAGWQGHTRAGSLDVMQVKGQAVSLTPMNVFSLTCASSPFYDRNVLLPNGDVVLCCMDYNLKHIIGNLMEQTYDEVFQNEQFLKLVKLNEDTKFSKYSICKSCGNVRRI